ncbi:MAG: hypothetical protein ACRDQA_23100 [Nocardioidaceae bacterium]
MELAELNQESAELLPDRQALGCWNHGSDYSYSSTTNIAVLNNLNVLSGHSGSVL